MTHALIVQPQDLIIGLVMLLAYGLFLLYAAKGQGRARRVLAFLLALASLTAAGLVFVPAIMYGLHP